MNYRITSFNKLTGRIDVLFDSGTGINVMLPVDQDGNVPIGTELEKFIQGLVPTIEQERNTRLQNGVKNASAIFELVQAVEPLDPILNAPSLDDAKVTAVNFINHAASNARRALGTDIYMQDMIYIIKAQQAKDYLSNKSGNFDFIMAESEIRGVEQAEAAFIIATAYDTWVAKTSVIEQWRLGGKNRVLAASNVNAVDLVMREAISNIQLVVQ